MYDCSGRSGEGNRQKADAAEAPNEYPLAWNDVQGLDRSQRHGSRLDQCPDAETHGVGEPVERRRADRESISECAGPSTAHSDLETVRAYVLTAGCGRWRSAHSPAWCRP